MAATAITIGNFDGVHRGHRGLVAAARAQVGPEGRVVALVFDPHPASVRRPDEAPPRLTDFAQRRELLASAGADEVARLDPRAGVLDEEPEAFLERLVAERAPSLLVEGSDFRFGRGRAAGIEELRAAGDRLGFAVATIEPVTVALASGQLVRASSTLLRHLLAVGRVGDVARVLGRPHELRGRVVRGDARGRTIDVPTANLDAGDALLPADGIYAGDATDPEGRWHPAAISVGTKPTFGAGARACEAHLIGWREAPGRYDWPIRVRLVAWLRDPIRFDGIDALRAQIGRDVERARAIVAREAEVAA